MYVTKSAEKLGKEKGGRVRMETIKLIKCEVCGKTLNLADHINLLEALADNDCDWEIAFYEEDLKGWCPECKEFD
jgi:Fe2+ or Zn2+ uptake regulation protein